MDAVADRFNIHKSIEIEKEKIRKKYLNSAEEIVSGYNKECELSKDYEGRQMFELIQNADDEAEGSSGKVRIVFDGKILSVSNTGNPFSFSGVKSLMYPYASPKKIHANKIGCKGLGFRSILTWAENVVVVSKDFTIKFSREYAKTFLQSVLEENPQLKNEIKTLTNEPWPIATLTCPEVLTNRDLEEDYSTSIIMECRKDVADVIEKQIVNLQFEELIFLPNLKEIEIICNDYRKVFYKVTENDEVIIETKDLTDNTTICASWKLYKETGTIKDEDGSDKDYEFIIAYDSTGKQCGEVLYSYFKTDIELGFPALIHGTFELTSDRNSLQKQSKVNEQLMPRLAKFMVQTAVRISEEQEECNYEPLSLVITSDMDIVLKDTYHLDRILRNEAHEKRILPTIGNKYISIKDSPKYTDYRFADVLNPKKFPELLKPAENFIEDYLESDLDIGFYQYEELCNRINEEVEHYSLEEKARLISLIKNKFRSNHYTDVFPHLLVDSNGKNICDSSKVYPLPNEEQLIALPQWVNIKFLSYDLEMELINALPLFRSKRELVNELSEYNMAEYSFKSLLSSVVNQFNSSSRSADKCSDVLNWLWEYYKQDDHQPIPQDIHVSVICRNGDICDAKECYIGKEYGNSLGERLVGLYSRNFIAYEDLKISGGDKAGVESFLEWLGASKYPRIVKKTLSKKEREPFLSTCYPLYVRQDDKWYDSAGFSDIHEVSVGSVENLERVIMESNFNDLLSWFILDNDINQRIYSDTEEKNLFACITGRPGHKQNLRKVTPKYIRSYLRYYLSTKRWIPDANGNKEKPAYCCFEDNSLDPFIIVPKIDYEYIKKEVGRNCRKEIDAILSRLGVADVFQEMTNTVVYETLKKLPELDTDCKLGRSIYRKIIREVASPNEYIHNSMYDDFINHGLVLAKQNGTKKYVPVSQVRYADKKVFSEEILGKFSMFDIDARSGEEKIKKLFGVQPLKYTTVKPDGEPVLHPLDEAFKKEYLRFMPFVFACRIGLKNANQDFRSLKSSKVILCSSITIRYKFETEVMVSKLKEYETVYLRKENTAYICLSGAHTDFMALKQSLKFADSVAESISAILDVNEDKVYFRDLFRENDYDREEKMRRDRGDENLFALKEARRRFNIETNLRDDFWMTLGSIVRSTVSEANISNADEWIAAMHLPANIDAGLKYEDLNSFDNIPILRSIFDKCGIDFAQYNSASNHPIYVSKYTTLKLKEKMKLYREKYRSYLINKLHGDENDVYLFDQYMEKYDYFEPNIENSFSLDIDSVFAEKMGVRFDDLDNYAEENAKNVCEQNRAKVSDEDWERIKTIYSPSKIDTYLILGHIDDLLNNTAETKKENKNQEQSEEQNIQDLARQMFSAPAQGFSSIGIQMIEYHAEKSKDAKDRKHRNMVHSESSDRKKREIGMVGEAFVYKELLEIYPDARWVSGNAEKAGSAVKGDDTCGYDIMYHDESGATQYVEVKASRNEDVSFIISDSELRFGCKNAANYEIIYVVVGEDGKPAHQPWRLGHIFDFPEGEDLFHNARFSIESDSYRVFAASIIKS